MLHISSFPILTMGISCLLVLNFFFIQIDIALANLDFI